MELNNTMRYVMAQVQKEAPENQNKIEYLFLGLLALNKMTAQELTSDAHIESDLHAVQTIFQQRQIQVEQTDENLRFLLNVYPTMADASGQMLKAMNVCKQQGDMEVTAAAMLEIILNSPSALIQQALLAPSNDKTTAGIVRQSSLTVPLLPSETKKTSRRQKVIAEKEKTPKPKYEVIPLTPENKPKVVRKRVSKPKPKPQIEPDPVPPDYIFQPSWEKVRHRINGFNISGSIAWAATKYFFWSLAIPIAILLLMEIPWHYISDPPSDKFIVGLPYYAVGFGIFMSLYGIISLLRRLDKAGAIFMRFIVNISLLIFLIAINMRIQQWEEITSLGYICIWVVIYVHFIYSLGAINFLSYSLKANQIFKMKTSILHLTGTSSIIFFSFLMFTMIIPLLTCTVITIFHISVNPAWKAIFSIGGFLWAYIVIIFLIWCLLLKYMKNVKKYRTFDFSFQQSVLLFLPLLGLFLMWYFNWLPMKTWVIWVYIIYGIFWLVMTISFRKSRR